MAKHEKGVTKRSLFFPKIQARDTGDYICRAEMKDGSGFLTKVIHVIVRNNIEWNTKGNRVGGVLGESLTIDCGAEGDPLPTIEITDGSGHVVSGESTLLGNVLSLLRAQSLRRNLQSHGL